MPTDANKPTVKPLSTNKEEIMMQRDNLLQLLKMIVLKGGCLHVQIDSLLRNPRKSPLTCTRDCHTSCLVCLDIIDDYIMPISRKGLCTFLADVFINNTLASLIPAVLEDKLKKFTDVGTIVYYCPMINKAPPSKYVIVTVLQLIVSGICCLLMHPLVNVVAGWWCLITYQLT